ncbi:hypothetical protein ABIA35_000555 [Catenulispora sp. MAP12-49]|uniref:RapZ C-terminal domain-containing protein n=1 Tax=Catenulispora sp. MAP12-49 TaxID=3156302 RepID=UPI003512467B
MSRVVITTFGVLHGEPPEGNALSVDLRTALRNPHDDPGMRFKTGLDAVVFDHVMATPGAMEIVDDTVARVLALFDHVSDPQGLDLPVHVFCKGGRHRSVAIAEATAARLRAQGVPVAVVHRDIDKPVVQKIPTSQGGSSLWAGFAADGASGNVPLARSLRTLAAFIDRHAELGSATVTFVGARGNITIGFFGTELDMEERAAAVQLLADALDTPLDTQVYDDGQVILHAHKLVAGNRHISIDAPVARSEQDPSNAAKAVSR